MAVSEIVKIRLISLDKHQERILELIQDLNFVETIEQKDEEKKVKASVIEYNLAQVKFAISFLENYQEEKLPLRDKLLGTKIQLTQEKLQKLVAEFEYAKKVEELTDLHEQINQAKNQITKFKAEQEALDFWKKLDMVPDELGETKYTFSTLGGINVTEYENLLAKLKKYKEATEIVKVTEDDKKKYLVIIGEIAKQKEIRKILTEIGWEEAVLPYPEKTPAQAILDLSESIKQEEQKIKDAETETKKYVKDLKKLKIVYDYLTWQVEKEGVKNNLNTTEKTFTLLGWIEKRNIEFFKDKLENITKQFNIEEVPIGKEEIVPVPLRNNKLFYPFEMVTGIYGMPQSKEPDPTPYLAGFFTIFFGMALTDAGYGFVLALFSFLAIKILKIPKEKSKLFKVLIWGGLATFVLGAMFGGWFGIIVDEQLPSSVANVLNSVKVIDPVANPILVLIITLIMGIIQVMIGIAISLYWKIKQGKLLDGILDDGVWLYFLGSICFWIMTITGVLPESLGTIAIYFIYAGILAVVLTGGRKQKNIFLKIPMGILSLYNLVGFFSDVLSYSRLLALGLATGIIAMVVNMIAMLAKDMIPYLGWVIAIIIIIGGHLFNLVINVLGAFIHSSRLQFVEFFGKFMEGGGNRFKPVHKQSKYIEIINQ